MIGFAAGEIPRIRLNLTLLKECQIVGVFWGAWALRNPKDQAQNMAELTTLYDSGVIRPLISESYALEDYLAAFESLAGRRAQGKLVLRMGPQD